MYTMCTHCGGMIAEPGKPYGWAGKWCHCVKSAPRDGEIYRPSRQVEIDELRRRLERLEREQRMEEAQSWRQFQAERREWLNANADSISPNRISLNR